MSGIKIDDIRSQLKDLSFKAKIDSGEVTEDKFSSFLENAIDTVNQDIQTGTKAVNNFISGQDTNLHSTLLALEKAEISYRLMMEVRTKLVSAYQEIMRTSV